MLFKLYYLIKRQKMLSHIENLCYYSIWQEGQQKSGQPINLKGGLKPNREEVSDMLKVEVNFKLKKLSITYKKDRSAGTRTVKATKRSKR